MRKDHLIDSLGRIDDDMIESVEALRRKKRRPAWIVWGALAACLCLAAVFSIQPFLHLSSQAPNDASNPASAVGPPNFVVNGVTYMISSYLTVTDVLPDGFALAGEASIDGGEPSPYYTNPEVPEWVYVCQEVMTDGTLDATGSANRTEPHDAYVRYVDIRLRGKDLVCYNGEYYISMWSADSYGDYPDVSNEYFDTMESIYGIRIEGEAPEGFVSAGIAEFSGHDSIPRGTLASNQSAHEVFFTPADPNVILVPTYWYTAAADENGETRHTGFDVYIRYDCPLA